MLERNCRNKISKILIFTIILSVSIMNINITTIYAYNNFWSSEAIADFIYNKVDISAKILNDKKYTTNITREEFAELIISMYAISTEINKEDISLKENPFKDTNSIDVQRAYSLGLVKGISEDKYSPTSNITREELATMMTRFLNANGITTDVNGNLNDFSDEKNISEWAYNSMLYCVKQDIIKGFNKELYSKAHTSIEQALTILDRIALKYEWFTPSKDSYYNGFFVPRDTELSIRTPPGMVAMSINWSEIKDYKKLENDLYYMLNSKLHDTIQINDLIKTIMSTESYYTNGNTKDLRKVFEIEGYTLRIGSSCNKAKTWIHMDAF